MNFLDEIKKRLEKEFNETVLAWTEKTMNYILIKPSNVFKTVEILKNEFQFNFLMDLFCVDYLNYSVKLPDNNRFEIITYLYSLPKNYRLFIKSYYPNESPKADSLCPLFHAANWFEREIYDMFGITFNNHPDLRRILMYEGFEGHPLRKDYDPKKRQPLVALIKNEKSVFEQ